MSGEPGDRRGLRPLVRVAGMAFLTVVLCDFAIGWGVPPIQLREVEDAIADLRSRDPTVLVLGSSHARSFVVVDEKLDRLSGGRQRMVSVPVEWGKWTSYEWVLRHRIWPALDRKARRGQNLPSFVLLVTEWWDSTALDPGTGRIDMNLPARSWTLSHFLRDLAHNGLTPYNQNYLQKVWRGWFRGSSLIQDRGFGRIPDAFRALLRGVDEDRRAASRQRQMAGWRRMAEEGTEALFDPEQTAALDRIIEMIRSRGMHLGVLLYPRMPGTLTEQAREGTLRVFAVRLRERCRSQGIPLWDHTTNAPLTDEDFAEDFDHILPEGNRRLADFLLEGSLRWLWDEGSSLFPEEEQ